jgi:hypothetical protein
VQINLSAAEFTPVRCPNQPSSMPDCRCDRCRPDLHMIVNTTGTMTALPVGWRLSTAGGMY